MALIGGLSCNMNVIEVLNNLDVDLFIGLGDVECPQYIRDFYGIVGEMEDVSVLKYLRSSGRYLINMFNISSDFSTEVVISHYPPKGSFTRIIDDNIKIGLKDVSEKILVHKPKLLFHAHSNIQNQGRIYDTIVISIGSLENGYYVEYYPEKFNFIFKRLW
ncbi:hypothetical protein [Saccharolobus caldissimus]|uniref:Metallophosphoesterase TT1561-like domain-containing protein n=1 Tax=Saccharolobus caldissimus TaxID=1702097 RepID=A0AAQ4CMS8_9CREN|nr:hypothetical protein [Saccharolobus caldissimus]BDB97109.1 hypothetical protein SACC_01260 [Saccharolobus caldissimus]